MDGLNTVLEYLTSVPAWYLATSVDGQPHVRPFSFAQIQDGKLWFVTARTKDVWQELLQNQRFEATSWWPGHGWLILRGRAGLDDRALDEMREAGWKHLERLGELCYLWTDAAKDRDNYKQYYEYFQEQAREQKGNK